MITRTGGNISFQKYLAPQAKVVLIGLHEFTVAGGLVFIFCAFNCRGCGLAGHGRP